MGLPGGGSAPPPGAGRGGGEGGRGARARARAGCAARARPLRSRPPPLGPQNEPAPPPPRRLPIPPAPPWAFPPEKGLRYTYRADSLQAGAVRGVIGDGHRGRRGDVPPRRLRPGAPRAPGH